MTRQASFMLGMLTGAGLMYLLDPERGRRRRALIRDQMVHGAHGIEELGESAAGKARDLRNRARGAVHETRARLRREAVDDAVLEQRVRTELGRLISHPGSIEVSADHGRITLSGSVLEAEEKELLAGVSAVRGVLEIVNRLQRQAAPANVPDLQEDES